MPWIRTGASAVSTGEVAPAINFFEVTVSGTREEMYLDHGCCLVKVPDSKVNDLLPYLGKRVIFGIRPENVHDQEYQPLNIEAALVGAKVDVTELMGNEIFLHLIMKDDQPFLARVDPRTKARPGHDIQVAFDMAQMHTFDPQTETVIGVAERP